MNVLPVRAVTAQQLAGWVKLVEDVTTMTWMASALFMSMSKIV
jgi:hypothetical protein